MIIARFVPIVRTFAPFVAGVGAMAYRRFILYSIGGSIGWVLIFTLGGYFFGNIPVVKQNFTLVIFAIIAISLLPGIVEYLRDRGRTQGREQLSAKPAERRRHRPQARRGDFVAHPMTILKLLSGLPQAELVISPCTSWP